jgi:hypothetical protein
MILRRKHLQLILINFALAQTYKTTLRQRDFAFLQATTRFAKIRQYKKLPKAESRKIDFLYKVIRLALEWIVVKKVLCNLNENGFSGQRLLYVS